MALMSFSLSFPFFSPVCNALLVLSPAGLALSHGTEQEDVPPCFPSICACLRDAEPLSFHPVEQLGTSGILTCVWCYLPFQSPTAIQVEGESQSLLPPRAVN